MSMSEVEQGISQMKVLVVDDSRTMRIILRRMLGELGVTNVVEAGDGKEALARIDEGRPDVVLVDWNMPVMNGLEFVIALRERRDCDRIKVMMVTSESSPRQIYDALRAGADEYAMKPVDLEVITGKLQLLGFE
jgi:two-component system, chemotaxis family, chemotaxis protein CheY